jgi:predicted kinase
MKVIICQGLPASGKSTWAKAWVTDRPGERIRINKDDLRAMLHNSQWSKKNEDVIVQVRNMILHNALTRGLDVVIDDTNFGKNENHIRLVVDGWWHDRTLMEQNESTYPEVTLKTFDISLTDALKRNSQRAAAVPDKVIIDMYRKYIEPNRSVTRGVYREPTPGLPECIIFDMDGTLAIPHPDRDPRTDCSTSDKDSPNVPILRLQQVLQRTNLPILIVSGREDGPGRKPTERWLKYYAVPYAKLLMRKTKDYRKDSIIKKEIFENDIAPFYNVVWVFDDRNQVVQTWRELGLCCLQVCEGNF